MIFSFLCGLNTNKADYEYVTSKYRDYKWPFCFGYWIRVNILRKEK